MLPTGWFHIAATVDPAAQLASVLLNGVVAGSAPLGRLGVVDTGANLGIGADANGAAHFAGVIDEIRFSKVARANFTVVLGPAPHAYVVDPQTIALYHLDESDGWIDEDRGLHDAINNGAILGQPGRFGAGLSFLGDVLEIPRCGSERDFQSRLNSGAWDRGAGGALVAAGPYSRFGYRQGAIGARGLDGALHPVLVNDQAPHPVRGRVTTACYGFAPTDPTNTNNPAQTIAAFQAAGRSVQEAIDYFGEWNGLPASFFSGQYAAHGITAAYEPCLAATGASTSVLIPASAEFAFDAATSFTIEAFINAQNVDGNYARAVIASRSTALRVGDPPSTEAGWALCLGPYRAIPNNLRWVLGDALGTLVTVDANFGLADGVFHHVAGVVDRDIGLALLFVDGVEVGQAPLAGLAMAATAGPITIGNTPGLNAPFAGLIDEVRISRDARRSFAPVLGESDTRYRQRLAIFQPWRLPTFPNIRRGAQALTLRDAAGVDVAGLLLGQGDIPPDLVQLDVDETDSTRFGASRWLRVIPNTIAANGSIAADGTSPATEPDTSGLSPLAASAPALVTESDGANYAFAPACSRTMVLATARMLERLAARLAAVSPASKMLIQSAYLPAVGARPATNDTLGRAVTVSLATAGAGFDLGALTALAFESGVAFAAHQAPAGMPAVLRLVAASGDDLDVRATAFAGGAANPGLDPAGRQIVLLNQQVTIAISRPIPQPVGGLSPKLDWSLLPAGPAAGVLTGGGVAVGFTGTAAGAATLAVRCTLPDGITTLVGSLPILIAPQSLEGCDVLGGDGSLNTTETAMSGPPEADFRKDYLLTSNSAAIDYAPNANRMQLALEQAVLSLARLAALEPGAPRITVLAAYDPASANLQRVGRGLMVAASSATLTAARLGALAFLAGFAYIERRRYPASVYLSVPVGNRFEIVAGPLRRSGPMRGSAARARSWPASSTPPGLPTPGSTRRVWQRSPTRAPPSRPASATRSSPASPRHSPRC